MDHHLIILELFPCHWVHDAHIGRHDLGLLSEFLEIYLLMLEIYFIGSQPDIDLNNFKISVYFNVVFDVFFFFYLGVSSLIYFPWTPL